MNALEYIHLAASNPSKASATTLDLLAFARNHPELGAFTFIEDVQTPLPSAPGGSRLRNLPIIIKDNIDVAGMPTTAGSRALGRLVPAKHAPAIQRLLDAGAHVIGKANLHEFSLGITSNNAVFGAARNPYSLSHIAGGSSGGTAAAVASGMALAGIGSDTGGSLRIPAALCGVVGFRPTTGRWPSQGVVTISHTRDTLGPLGRTVADCALLDAVVCRSAAITEPVSLSKLRIGVPRELFWTNLEASVSAACERILSTLEASGVELIDVELAIDEGACTHAGMVIALSELFPSIEGYLKQHDRPFNASELVQSVTSPDVRNIMASLLGPDAPAPEVYEQALHIARPGFQRAYADCYRRHNLEAIIFPTTPLPAARVGEDDTVMLNGQAEPTFLTFARQTGPGSLVGVPGICLPIGCNAEGLPLSIALDAPVMQDQHLLGIAMAIEALLPAMPAPGFFHKTY